MKGSHPAFKFIKTMYGPFGSVRSCALCHPTNPFTRVIRAGHGGFAAGNRANGDIIQHIKNQHPDSIVNQPTK